MFCINDREAGLLTLELLRKIWLIYAIVHCMNWRLMKIRTRPLHISLSGVFLKDSTTKKKESGKLEGKGRQ